MSETCGNRPIIEYPVTWVYKVIGVDPERVLAAVAAVVGSDEYVVSPSHRSATGKYRSFNVELVVRDEEHRTDIFEALRSHPDIVMVL
jgi:putative lipoic acid-binding regulatory protein